MSKTAKNYKYIFLPYLAISLICIVGLGAVRWLLVIELEWLPNEEIIWEYVCVGVAVFPLVLFWLRPGVLKLHDIFDGKDNKDRKALLFISLATIFISAILVQQYISTQSGQQTISTIEELPEQPTTKYYQLKNYKAFNNLVAGYVNRYEDSRWREICYDYYMVNPLFSKPDTGNKQIKAWYCMKFQEKVDQRIFSTENEEEKTSAFEGFMKDSLKRMNYYKTDFFMSELNDVPNKYYGKAVAHFLELHPEYSLSGETPFLLYPQRWAYEYRSNYTHVWAIFLYLLGTLIFWFFSVFSEYRD